MRGKFSDDREACQQVLLCIHFYTDLPGIKLQGRAQEEDSLDIQRRKVVSSAACRHWPSRSAREWSQHDAKFKLMY